MQRLRQPPKSEACFKCLQLGAVLPDAGNEWQAVHSVPFAAAHLTTASLACLKGACSSDLHPTCRCFTRTAAIAAASLTPCQRSVTASCADTHSAPCQLLQLPQTPQLDTLMFAALAASSTVLYLQRAGREHKRVPQVSISCPWQTADCTLSAQEYRTVSFPWQAADWTLPAQEHTQDRHVCRVRAKTAAHPASQPA